MINMIICLINIYILKTESDKKLNNTVNSIFRPEHCRRESGADHGYKDFYPTF